MLYFSSVIKKITLLASLLLIFGVTVFAQIPIESYEDLMASRQKISNATANFVETRHISFMAKPIQIEGSLEFDAFGYLKKTITKPKLDILEYSNGTITHTDYNNKTQSFDATISPMANATTAGLLSILSGNETTLEQFFHVKFGIEENGWLLHLRPKLEEVADSLIAIRVFGVGSEFERIEIFETAGDRSFMEIKATTIEWKND